MSADYGVRWLAIAGLWLINLAWLWARGTSVEFHTLDDRFRDIAFLLVGSVLPALITIRVRIVRSLFARTSDYFYSIMQLTLSVPALLTLSYLVATWDRPLVDGTLLHWDKALGFDWQALSAWIAGHYWAGLILRNAYDSTFWQPVLVTFFVSLYQPGKTNGEFIWAFVISAVLCFSIGAMLPALGYPGLIGQAHIDALNFARSGTWTTLDFNKIDGIVTFPSFHAALAVIFPYAVRRIRWLLALLILLNGSMLIATPSAGGHYFVDVIAGIAIAVASIAVTRAIQARVAMLGSIDLGTRPLAARAWEIVMGARNSCGQLVARWRAGLAE